MKPLQFLSAPILAILVGSAYAAQPDQGGEYAPPPPAQQAQPVTDTQLEQFATAMSGVRSVQQEYSEAIQQSGNMEDAQALRAEAQQEMRGAVEDSGLSVSEYNTIAQQLQSNPDLSRRLQNIQSE